MKPESELLKYTAKEVVYGGYTNTILELLQSSKINFSRLKNLLLYHELAHFLYIIVNEVPRPKARGFLEQNTDDLFIFLRDTHFRQLANYMHLHDALLAILKEAKHKGLMLIPIKGHSYPEKYYERFVFRPMVDIDLLIKNVDFEKAVKLLEDTGYKKHLLGGTENYWKEKECHLGFMKENNESKIFLELHWSLDFEINKQEILPTLWNRLQKVSLENNEFYVMSPEDKLISLVIHQRRFGKTLNLKYICDLGILLEKENLDWDYIVATVRAGKLKSSLFFMLAHAQIVLDKNLSKHLSALGIPYWQRKSALAMIKKHTYSCHTDFNLFYLYLSCHFLVHDTIAESIVYILQIPLEQFAKFYALPLYTRQTKLRYQFRFIYIFYRLIKHNLARIFQRIN